MTTTNSNKKLSTVLNSWCSISDKTVFILDRSEYFTHVSSGHLIKGDFFWDPKKSAYDGEPPIPPFDRSLWTCAVEAVVGYSRLIWDLFSPEQKAISILTANPSVDAKSMQLPTEPHLTEKLCTWSAKEQSLDHLLRSLARRSHRYQTKKLVKSDDIASYPNCNSESPSVTCALEEALSELSRLTPSQIDRRAAKRNISTSSSENNGRIILITSLCNEQSMRRLIDKFEQLLKRKNESLELAISQDNSSVSVHHSPINYCDLVIMNTFPINDSKACSAINQITEFRPRLHVKSFSVKSGKFISGLLNNLCLQHHNLKSTTITGIPMKEEQNSSSSSQYDVEIVHCSSIHQDVMNLDPSFLNGVVAEIDRNGFSCNTFKLNWCTPRTAVPDMHHCVATSRITSVNVNSRPSSCLTNFLLSGKQVLLEIYKSKSNRLTTHVLANHHGELFIHSLATSQHKSNVGDPPSISENLGGKVSDYRLHDFVALMKQHMLVKMEGIEEPLTKSINLIRRHTLYWPISLGHTILMNIPNRTGELTVRTLKESMSQADVEECKKVIDSLIICEKEAVALPSITIAEVQKAGSSKGGNPKLDQLYKLLWNELEYFLRVHSTTPEHETVLDHLIERRGHKTPAHDRGTKRVNSTKTVGTIEPSPVKKQKVTSKLIPELSEPGATEAFQRTAIFYKTGATLYQTWSSLYNLYHRSRSKLPFVGRSQPPVAATVVQRGGQHSVPMDT